MTLNELAKEIRTVNENNGWNILKPDEWDDTYKIPAILALIHSEVSEALEAFRKEHDAPEHFKEEIADIIIRCLDCAGGIEAFDIDAVIKKKLEANSKRGFRHGNRIV